MDQLQEALDALAGLDLDGLPDGPLLDHLREAVGAVNRLTAHVTRVVRRVDVRGACEHDGARTAASWLRGTPGWPVPWRGGWSGTGGCCSCCR